MMPQRPRATSAALTPASGSVATSVVLLLAAVASASAAVYYALDARAARAAARSATSEKPGASSDEDGAAAGAGGSSGSRDGQSRLERENLELKRRLAQLMAQAATGETGGGPGAERPRGGRGAWLDQLKEKDPERYKKMVERREQRRLNAEVALQEQMGRVEERLEAQRAATEAANGQESPEQQKRTELLNKIASTLQDLSGLRDKWQDIQQLPDAERFDQAQALFQQSQQLRSQLADLQAQDRSNQLHDLGGRLGLSDDQTEDLARSVDKIVKDTSPPRGGGRPGGGAPGGTGAAAGAGGARAR